MNKSTSHEDLIVWQRAVELAVLAYKHSSSWPKSEIYGLTSQFRRAAVSIPLNIAEGQGRNGKREFLHHLGIAHGSLGELDTLVVIAVRLSLLGSEQQLEVQSLSRQVRSLLNGLMKSIRAQVTKSAD